MAALGHDVSFYSWVGDDGNGAMILDELSDAGVDTSNILVSGQTCETYNLFDPRRKRLAFSFWEPKLDFQRFVKAAKKEKPDAVFLTGAHRVKQGLGYSQLLGAYVFTGSFAGYTKKELESKYAEDLSKGILVSNDTEIMQLSGARDPISGMKRLGNEIIIMHGPLETAVKRGSEIITADTGDMDMGKVKELTGIGDVWEAVFIGLVGKIQTAPADKIEESLVRATQAAVTRMLTGKFPKKI
jgi:sugar/nucleoside kinase (ribokinase family)